MAKKQKVAVLARGPLRRLIRQWKDCVSPTLSQAGLWTEAQVLQLFSAVSQSVRLERHIRNATHLVFCSQPKREAREQNQVCSVKSTHRDLRVSPL